MKLDYEQGKAAIGATTVFFLVIFYSSPLSTLAMVIKTRNSESIHGPLAIANGINGILWTVYGVNQSNIVSNIN
jgi:solute carrier family 50 protein (sugar transporter)